MARVEPVRSRGLGDGYSRGVALVVVAGVIFSTGGLLIRWMEDATGWQILFYRSLAMIAVILTAIVVKNRGSYVSAFRAAGWATVIGGVALAVAMSCYVFAVLHTTVANVLFVLSTAPLAAAWLGWLILGERVAARTLGAAVAAVVGVGVMTLDALGESRLFGSVISLVMVSAYAVFVITLRRHKAVDMLPSVCVGGVLLFIFAGIMAADFGISGRDLFLALLLGGTQAGIGVIILIRGSVHVPAVDLAVLAMVEVVLGPLWVWWGVGEVPSGLTFVGGGIVLAAMVYRAVAGIRDATQITPRY